MPRLRVPAQAAVPSCPLGPSSAWNAAPRFHRGGTSEPAAAPQSYTPKHLAERILSSKSALEGERKQVTVLFADLKGSMELLAERDPEEARALLDPVLQRMMDAVPHSEGTVNQVMGDGIMALFGAPLAHEDHAVRACYAALRMQESVARYADELQRSGAMPVQIRVGINSGEVVVRAIGSDLHMDYTAVGQSTHLAARIEQLASLDAAVRIEGSDRAGLERLLRNSCAPALRAGAPRAGRSQPTGLSFSQAPARWQHATAADACGTARAAGRADPAPAPAPPPLSRGAPNAPQRLQVDCLGAAANPTRARSAASGRSRAARRALPGAHSLGGAASAHR